MVFFFMFWLWWTRGRDPRLRPIAAQYEPPAKLTPGEAGTLVDNSADMRDITASIVDLAVRGYILIEEKKKDHLMGLIHDKDYVFHLRKPRNEWNSLKPHEQELLDGLFTAGANENVTLSDLHNKFYTYLPRIKDQIFGSLVNAGYYRRRPDSVRAAYIGSGVAVGILMVWGGISVANLLGIQPMTLIVACVLTGNIICAFGLV